MPVFGKVYMKEKIDLSVVIVTYKSEGLIEGCIDSVYNTAGDLKIEVVLSDNSPDSKTEEAVKKIGPKYPRLKFIRNKKNEGFSRGNNIAIREISGEYVLFLNPDMKVDAGTLNGMVEFMKKTSDAGAATCAVRLVNGELDDSCHRGFPTPWRAFSHFTKLSKLFPKSKLFAGYNLTYLDFNKTHEIDALAGSFMIIPFGLGKKLNWWDEDYFFYGEDIDFCYRIKEMGYKIYFVPKYTALHYKGASSGIKKISKEYSSANKATKKWATEQRFKAMEIFYKKHYKDKYPGFVRALVLTGIQVNKFIEELKL